MNQGEWHLHQGQWLAQGWQLGSPLAGRQLPSEVSNEKSSRAAAIQPHVRVVPRPPLLTASPAQFRSPSPPAAARPQVYFGLPTPAQRLAILQVHTRRWGRPPPEGLLRQVAARTEGYAGADLQALCTAAVMAAVRRSAPLLLELAEQEGREGSAAPGHGADNRPQVGAAGSAADAHGSQQQQQASAAAQPHAHEQQQAGQQQSKRQQQRQHLLDGLEVQAHDWREALAAAPPPCSRRHGLSALAAEAATPLQQQELPLVAGALKQLLAAMHAADLPLPPAAAAAAQAASTDAQAGSVPAEEWASAGAAAAGPSVQRLGEPGSARLESVLLEHGALRPSPSSAASAGREPAPAATDVACGSRDRRAARLAALGDEGERLGRLGRSYPPCRLLLWGEGEQGQEAAAGAVLKLFDGEPPRLLLVDSFGVQQAFQQHCCLTVSPPGCCSSTVLGRSRLSSSTCCARGCGCTHAGC